MQHKINQIIPKTIFITHGAPLPSYVLPKWKILNPTFTIECYNDQRCRAFLKAHFGPKFVHIFNSIPDGPIRADFWRVCILYTYGGYYVDADINPQVSFDSFVEPNVSFITCLTNNTLMARKDSYPNKWNPHLIGTTKDCPIMHKCIDIYMHFYAKQIYSYWGCSLVRVMGEALKDLSQNVLHQHKDGVYIYKKRTYQFLKESNPNKDLSTQHCFYNHRIILYDRYKTYDPQRHQWHLPRKSWMSPHH